MKWGALFLLVFVSTTAQAFYYPESYEQSRRDFLTRAKKISQIYKSTEVFRRPVTNNQNADISIDALFIPPQIYEQNEPPLMILTSGIHGVEGYTGSAIQQNFLDRLIKTPRQLKYGILVIHSLNPFGFHFHTRVDEDNVDLNRNFSAKPKNFQSKVEDYEHFDSFINPTHTLSVSWWQDILLFGKALYRLFYFGTYKLRVTSIGGQYEKPKGIYYGGQKLQQNVGLVSEICRHAARGFNKIVHIDLHTGYGERGRLHFFSNKQVSQQPGFDTLLGDYDVDLAEDEDFYKTHGSIDYYMLELFSDKKLVVPIVFEFGTMDSQTTLGGFFSLRNMIYENQGRHYGYVNTFSEQAIKNDFMEMFNPSDIEWRTKVVNRGLMVLEDIAKKTNNL